MSEQILTVPFNGKQTPAVRVHVNGSQEHFNTYNLEDGTLLKLKAVTVDVLRLVDVYMQRVTPIYFVRCQNVTLVDAPPSLRRPS